MFRALSSGVVLNRFTPSTVNKWGLAALPTTSAACTSTLSSVNTGITRCAATADLQQYQIASSASSSLSCSSPPSFAVDPAYLYGGHKRSLFSSTRVSLQRGGSSDSGDYYATLGVAPDAAPEEVKASYKRLALQFHPDRNRAADAEEKFKTISEAYAVIGNKEKRAEYDAVRRSGFSGFGSSGGNSNHGQGSTYQGQRGYSRGGSGFKHGQGMRQGGGQPRPGQQQHPHVRTLSREEAEQMFRSIFNMGIEQMAAANNANRGAGGGPLGGMPGMPGMGRGMPRGNGLNSNLGSLFSNIAQQGNDNQHPFFRGGRGGGAGAGATESTRVEFDEFGNRSVHRQFTDANGNIYNIYTEESDDQNASMNQTKEQVNERYYDPRTGRYSYGTYGSVGEDKGGGGYTNWAGIKGGGGPNAEQSGGGEGAKNSGGSSDGSNSRAYPEYAQFIYRNTPVGGNPAIRLMYVFLWTSLILTLGMYMLIFLFSHPVLLVLVLGIMLLRRVQPIRRF